MTLNIITHDPGRELDRRWSGYRALVYENNLK